MLRDDKELEKIEEMSRETSRVMEEIARASKSETVDLINDHELKGVTPEMIDWWWDHINNTERYKLWHPNDHISFKWEKTLEKGHFGAIQRVVEIVKVPTMLRIRWEETRSIPIKAAYSHLVVGSVLDSNDKPLTWILHEYESIDDGTRSRTTFRLASKTPRWFIKALRKHNIEEIGEFTNFLPKLYEENK
ncbi:MAG: DAPG hydrolase family protein [Promethearchaeota archaeon]